MQNINHRNHYTIVKEAKIEAPKEAPKIEAPKEEIKEEPKPTMNKADLYDLTKSEQIEMLKDLGVKYEDIKKLKKEADRVNKILELI